MNEKILAGIVHLKNEEEEKQQMSLVGVAGLGGFQALARFSLSETEFHTANRLQCY